VSAAPNQCTLAGIVKVLLPVASSTSLKTYDFPATPLLSVKVAFPVIVTNCWAPLFQLIVMAVLEFPALYSPVVDTVVVPEVVDTEIDWSPVMT
jgi:hypothetical protein